MLEPFCLRGCVRSPLSWREPMNHHVDHDDKDHGLTAGYQHFIVLAHTAVSTDPSEGTFHDPPLGQYRKARNLIASFDDLQCPAADSLRPIDQLPGVATVGPDAFQSRVQASQLAKYQFGSVAVLNVGRMDHHRQDQTERVDDQVPLPTVHLLAGIVAARPPFSVVFTLWLSTMAADGDGFRPAAVRTFSRRAS